MGQEAGLDGFSKVLQLLQELWSKAAQPAGANAHTSQLLASGPSQWPTPFPEFTWPALMHFPVIRVLVRVYNVLRFYYPNATRSFLCTFHIYLRVFSNLL